MNFLHRLRRRLAGWPVQSTGQDEERDADNQQTSVPFDQVERLNDSGASLQTVLEMNRVQGW